MCFISLVALTLTFIYGLLIATENSRSNQRIAEEIERFVTQAGRNSIQIGEDKIVYITPKYKGEIQWEKFTHYLKSDSTIWLYPSGLIPECPPLSIEAIGKENFQKLVLIAEQKLQRVN